MGLIINLIGSLAVEPILKKFCFIKYMPYPVFAKAAKADSKIDTLSEMNNITRTLLSCILLLPVMQMLQVFSIKWTWFSLKWGWGAIAFLFMLFLFAYRKQTDYVRKRVEAVNSQMEKEKETKEER
jgi:Na+/melibiose symporter-like transporter